MNFYAAFRWVDSRSLVPGLHLVEDTGPACNFALHRILLWVLTIALSAAYEVCHNVLYRSRGRIGLVQKPVSEETYQVKLYKYSQMMPMCFSRSADHYTPLCWLGQTSQEGWGLMTVPIWNVVPEGPWYYHYCEFSLSSVLLYCVWMGGSYTCDSSILLFDFSTLAELSLLETH